MAQNRRGLANAMDEEEENDDKYAEELAELPALGLPAKGGGTET